MPEKQFNVPPWHPITEPVKVAVIGKALEELSELQKILARILIQGIDESDPKDETLNRDALTDEVADVYAQLCLLTEKYDLDTKYIDRRISKKMMLLESWYEKL